MGWNKPSTDAATALTAPPKKSMVDNVVDWVSNLVGAPKLIAPPPADETTAQAQLVSGFLGGLSVEAVRNTHLVNIKYQSPDPQRAQQAANALALEYIASSKDSRSGASKVATDYLKQQLDEQQGILLESQAEAGAIQGKRTTRFPSTRPRTSSRHVWPTSAPA